METLTQLTRSIATPLIISHFSSIHMLKFPKSWKGPPQGLCMLHPLFQECSSLRLLASWFPLVQISYSTPLPQPISNSHSFIASLHFNLSEKALSSVWSFCFFLLFVFSFSTWRWKLLETRNLIYLVHCYILACHLIHSLVSSRWSINTCGWNGWIPSHVLHSRLETRSPLGNKGCFCFYLCKQVGCEGGTLSCRNLGSWGD